MTKEERKAKIQALLEERAGYKQRNLPDRVAQVNEQLRLLGAEAKTPAAVAEKRPAPQREERASAEPE